MALSGTDCLPDDAFDEHFLTLVEEEEARAVKRRCSLPTSGTSTSPVVSGGKASAEVEDEGSYMAALRGSKSSTWQQQQLLTRQGVGRGRAPGAPNADGSHAGYADGGVRSENGCFKCGMPGHWAKDCTEMAVGGSQGRSQRESASGGNQVPDKTCPCGIGVCSVFTSNTAKNPGRKFYRCPAKPEEGGCNFFEWCDNQPPSGISNTISSPVSRITSSQGGCNTKFHPLDEKSRFSCYKCGQDGHWSKDCPLLSSQSNADAGSGRSGSSGTCFKCGQDGHWSKDCPLTSSQSNLDAGSGRSGSSGTCFKCGQDGHCSKDCPLTCSQSNADAGAGRSGSSGTCYKCGQDGHWSRNCPLLTSQSNADAGSGRSGSSFTCYKCGKAGHWARDCTAQVSSASVGNKRFSSSHPGYQ